MDFSDTKNIRNEDSLWKSHGTISYRLPRRTIVDHKIMIASFDLYGTLIQGDAGEEFPSESDNWIWTNPLIPEFLNQTYKDGFAIVIFSNLKNSSALVRNHHHIDSMINEFDFEPFVFFSTTSSGKNSKPNVGMWDFFSELTGSTPREVSFYCGNSEGPKSKNPLYSAASTDYDFSKNINLAFYNPDEMFPKYEPEVRDFDGGLKGTKELIITVGQQGSGKSTFSGNCSKNFGYTIIARPKQGTKTVKGQKVEKHLDMIVDAFNKGASNIIYDATNPSLDSREPTIQLGKKLGVKVTIWWFSRPGKEFNKLREAPIPKQGLQRYTNLFQRPSIREGVDSVIRIN